MAAKGTTEMEVGGDGVAVITICNPPVNSLSIDVLLSLKESYEEALQRKDVKAIVVTGTQRLPRLVGLTKSLEMVLLSKPIKGEEAHQLGLVDALVSPNDLVNTARRLALDICELRKPWIKSLYKTHKLEPLGGDSQVCKGSSSKAGCKS